MPAPVPLSSILTSVQRRANVENFVSASGSLISLSELREYANEVGAEMYDLLVEARGQEFNRKTYNFTTAPSQAAYPLPSDFYELISMDIFVAPNQVLTARPYMEEERNRFRWYPGWFYNQPVYFRMLGASQSIAAVLQPGMINLIPAPTSQNAIVLNYVPVFRGWATDGSEDMLVIDGINGWEAYIIWGVVAICLEKMEQNSEFALARQAKVEERIRAMAPDRHAGDAERVHDVSLDYEPFGNGP